MEEYIDVEFNEEDQPPIGPGEDRLEDGEIKEYYNNISNVTIKLSKNDERLNKRITLN